MVRGGVDCGQSIEALTQGVRQLLTLKVTPLGNFDSPIDRTTRTLFLLLLDCRRKPWYPTELRHSSTQIIADRFETMTFLQ